jgi:alanine-synthesizing transaminase
VPSAEEIEALVTPRTRALVVINPNNPTGAVYPRELLEKLVDIARRHHLLLMADEIYDQITYDGAEFEPMAAIAHDVPCLSFGGLSKVHRACGWRTGWALLSGEATRLGDYHHAIDLLGALRLCANVPGQFAVPAALGRPDTITPLCVRAAACTNRAAPWSRPARRASTCRWCCRRARCTPSRPWSAMPR